MKDNRIFLGFSWSSTNYCGICCRQFKNAWNCNAFHYPLAKISHQWSSSMESGHNGILASWTKANALEGNPFYLGSDLYVRHMLKLFWTFLKLYFVWVASLCVLGGYAVFWSFFCTKLFFLKFQLISEKMPELLDFGKDLVHLEAASKVLVLFSVFKD